MHIATTTVLPTESTTADAGQYQLVHNFFKQVLRLNHVYIAIYTYLYTCISFLHSCIFFTVGLTFTFWTLLAAAFVALLKF